MRLVGRGNFHLKIVYAIFLSELNCHFQNYQCPGHFFRITSGEFVNEHIRTVPTNGKYFFPDNDYVRQVDHIRGY